MSLKDRLFSKTQDDGFEIASHPKTQGSFGILDTLLADDETNYIYVFGAKNICVQKKGKTSRLALGYRDEYELEEIIRDVLSSKNIELDENNPIVQFTYKTGVNISAVFPPLSRPVSMIIKCYKDKFASVQSLMDTGAYSKEIALTLEAMSARKVNVLIAGKSNTLKTTLLSAMAKRLPQNDTGVIIDFSNELKNSSSNIVNYNLKSLTPEILRHIDTIFMSNPDKIYLNDAPLDEFKKYSDYRGLVAVLRANSLDEALSQVNNILHFDIVIMTSNNPSKRQISSVFALDGNKPVEIFKLKEGENNDESSFVSCGNIPKMFLDKNQNTPFNLNIFNSDYIHTIPKKSSAPAQKDRTIRFDVPNIDILKKFKRNSNTEIQQEPRLILQTEPSFDLGGNNEEE